MLTSLVFFFWWVRLTTLDMNAEVEWFPKIDLSGARGKAAKTCGSILPLQGRGMLFSLLSLFVFSFSISLFESVPHSEMRCLQQRRIYIVQSARAGAKN